MAVKRIEERREKKRGEKREDKRGEVNEDEDLCMYVCVLCVRDLQSVSDLLRV